MYRTVLVALALVFSVTTHAVAQFSPGQLAAAVAQEAINAIPDDDPAAPRHTKAQAVGFWAWGAVQMIDTAQTQRLIGEGRGVETNPLLQRASIHPEAFAIAKWSIAGVSAFAAWDQFDRGHRKAGWTILIAGMAATSLVIANNHRILRPGPAQ